MDKNRLDRLEDKIDNIRAHIEVINVTMTRNTASLEEHMRRTDALEKKLKPVETHVERINGIVKFLLFCSGVAALIKAFK